MAHENKAMQSVNVPGGLLCVDIVWRPDCSFGFEEVRRDPEDARGWYPVGHYRTEVFHNPEAARATALRQIIRLAEASPF